MELVYNVLDSLWTAALYRIHSLSVTTLAEKESEDVEESDSEEDSDYEDMLFRSDVEPDESDSESARKSIGNEGVPPPSEDSSAEDHETPRRPRSEDELVHRHVSTRPIDVRSSPSMASRGASPLSLSLERIGEAEMILKSSKSDDSGKDSEDEDMFSAPRKRRSRTSTHNSFTGEIE